MVARPSRTVPPVAALVLAILLAACAASPAAPSSTPQRAAPTEATGSVPASMATAPTASPAAAAPSAPAAFPLELVDDEGTAVTIAREPERIVTLTPAATETVFALGVGDRLVGKAEDIFLYPPEAAAVPDVERFDGSALVVDVERIVAAEADLVIAGGNFGTPPDAVQRLRDLQVPVVVVYAPSVEGVLGDIELIGRAVGRPEAAAGIVAQMRAAFAAVEDAVAGEPRPRTFYEIDATGAYYGPADDSFLAEMISLAGGEPITTGSPTRYDIAAERLVEADPEVILLADAAYGVTAADVEERPGWSTMTAVRKGDIRPIEDVTITRPGPRLVQGLQLLASTIHPDVPVPSTSPVPAVP